MSTLGLPQPEPIRGRHMDVKLKSGARCELELVDARPAGLLLRSPGCGEPQLHAWSEIESARFVDRATATGTEP